MVPTIAAMVLPQRGRQIKCQNGTHLRLDHGEDRCHFDRGRGKGSTIRELTLLATCSVPRNFGDILFRPEFKLSSNVRLQTRTNMLNKQRFVQFVKLTSYLVDDFCWFLLKFPSYAVSSRIEHIFFVYNIPFHLDIMHSFTPWSHEQEGSSPSCQPPSFRSSLLPWGSP